MTMRYQPLDRDRRAEPAFELPPRLAGSGERRLAGRATARWSESRNGGAMPFALAYGGPDALLDDEFGENGIMLTMGGSGVIVESVTSDVAAAFGIVPGRLVAGADGGIAGALLAACATIDADAVNVPFEGVFRGADQGAAASATLLTRGVVLPLADARGRCSGAHAVVAWRELFAGPAAAALRRELAAALGDVASLRPARDAFRH